MGYTHLDKLLNVVLKLKYDWISKIDVPYHSTFGGVDVYQIYIYINENIFSIVDKKLLENVPYKLSLHKFERTTKTNFKFIERDIEELFRTQIMSGRVEQEIWIYMPKNMRSLE